MIGVILAAGRGTRMRGLTQNRPKAMLPVVGQPIVARVVDQLQAARIDEVIVVIPPDDDQIQPYFAAQPPARTNLRFAVQREARGMAHALLEAAPLIDDDFILTACDSLYPDDHYRNLAAMHPDHHRPATLTLMEVPPSVIPRASSVEQADGLVIRVVEKPPLAEAPSNIASLALYAFDRQLLDYLGRIRESDRGELELQDAIQLMIADAGGLPGLTTAWRWELTAPADLLAMNLNVLAMQPAQVVAPPGLEITPPVFVEAGVTLGEGVRLGPNVYLEAGARIGPAATLRDCVVLRDGVVPAGDFIDRQLVSRAVS